MSIIELEQVEVDCIPSASRYKVVKFPNGFFGVIDSKAKGMQVRLAGSNKKDSVDLALRLNLREAWGV